MTSLPIVGAFTDDKVQEFVKKGAVGRHDRSRELSPSLWVGAHAWMLCLVQVVERSRGLTSHDRKIRGHLFSGHSRLVQPIIGGLSVGALTVRHDTWRRFGHVHRPALGNVVVPRVGISMNQVGVVEIF